MIPVEEAIRIILEKAAPLPSEDVALADALGRVLAEDVAADTDLPPFDRAQMDGYAVRSEDLRETRASLIASGERVLTSGEEITAARAAVLAAFGRARVKVRRRPRAAVLATGTELVRVEETPGEDQIRDSNTYSLAAYARLEGAEVERLPLAGDDPELLRREIEEAAARSDVLVLSGGVSMGRYDFTKDALGALGAEVFFERVAIRPGKPTFFARLRGARDTLVFGLPGNPVSVSVTFNLFARTALRALQGAASPAPVEERAVLARAAKGAGERASYLPAHLTTDGEGRQLAEVLKWGGSSDFVAFAQAGALVIVPAGVKTID